MSGSRSASDPTDPDDASRERTFRDWVLLRGDRFVVAGGIVGLFLAFFVALELSDLVPLTNVGALIQIYGGVFIGNITLITLVVSINQLLISRELRTPGELQDQISNVIDYRREVEAAAGGVAPVEPLGFLRLLIENTREEAQRLGGLTAGDAVDADAERIDAIVDALTDRMDHVDRLVTGPDAGTIDVLSAMLATNYARQINALRRVKHRREDGEDLPEAVEEAIDGLIDRLQHIDVARQYFKTIYFQQELSSLSRMLLYAGLPAEAITVATLLSLTVPGDVPGAVEHLRVLVPAALTVGMVPLAVLSSFILRTATVTRRTAATIPFTAPEQEK